MMDIEAALWDMFYNGILVGMLVGIGLSVWFWWMMRFADKKTFSNYLVQLEPATRTEITDCMEELTEDIKAAADKTNTRIFKRWYNTLIEIDYFIKHKL